MLFPKEVAMAFVDAGKKSIVADIIRRLHKGLPVEEAKNEILRDVGKLSSAEITDIEQSLIDEGVSPDEIRRFCNVHALLFASALEKEVASPDSPSHPVNMLTRENREIEKIIAAVRGAEKAGRSSEMRDALARLAGIEGHYAIKENALFPHLERHGFPGPSKVMWSKHNEVRAMLKSVLEHTPPPSEELAALLGEVEGMIFKEESILFPAALERIPEGEWTEVYRSSEQIGYPFLQGANLHQTLAAAEDREGAKPALATGQIALPTGQMTVEELTAVLDTLPVDITFVDAADRVKYFSQSKDRIFVRATSVIGRKVENCHPPQSVGKVVEIVESFRNGSRDHADFWIQLKGMFVHIRYFAVRSREGKYLGTLEVTQDLTEIKGLTGERRLLNDAG
jgi:uncharacterized protein